VETSIPRKRGPAIAGYDKAINNFFEQVLEVWFFFFSFSQVRRVPYSFAGYKAINSFLDQVLELQTFFSFSSTSFFPQPLLS